MKKWSKAGMVCAAILAAGMAVTACGGGNTAKTETVSYTHLDVYKRQALRGVHSCRYSQKPHPM